MAAHTLRWTLTSALAAAFALGAPAVPVWAGSALIYVTNSAGDSIHAIDPATNKVVQEIKGIEAAHGIVAAPDGTRVYVSNEADSTLDVFDRATGTLVKKVQLSNRPNNVAVSKSGDRIFVGIARGQGAVDVINASTLTLTKSILVKGRLHNIYTTPDGKYLITGSIANKLMTVIDLEREMPVWELPFDLGVQPMTIEAAPDGTTKRIFVQLSDTNGFAIVDFAARKEIARIILPKASSEFETDAGRATSPSHGIGVAPDNKTLWVTSIPNNAVFVYSLEGSSLSELKLIGEVALPSLPLAGRAAAASVPNWVTFTPDSSTIYISNAAIRSVTAIDTASKTVKAVIPVGEVPKRITTLLAN
ncbi:MAG: YncE family protein [Xanthobacteraceae bacterium]